MYIPQVRNYEDQCLGLDSLPTKVNTENLIELDLLLAVCGIFIENTSIFSFETHAFNLEK